MVMSGHVLKQNRLILWLTKFEHYTYEYYFAGHAVLIGKETGKVKSLRRGLQDLLTYK